MPPQAGWFRRRGLASKVRDPAAFVALLTVTTSSGGARICARLEGCAANIHAAHNPFSAVMYTLIVPSDSAVMRRVLESKAMSARRRLVISAATRTPSSFF
jgi:hypothetical protein